MGVYDFGVDHDLGEVSMPEHCILTYTLAVRFPPVAEGEINPLCYSVSRDWQDHVGEPGMPAKQRPQAVRGRDFVNTGGASLMGYLPAGWRWRSRWNIVGERLEDRGSFPVLREIGFGDAAQHRDARRIQRAFRTEALGHYDVDLDFDEISESAIPGPRSSLFTGG